VIDLGENCERKYNMKKAKMGDKQKANEIINDMIEDEERVLWKCV